MTRKKVSFKTVSLLVVLTVFLSTFLAVLPASAASRGAWAPNTSYAVNDTVTYRGRSGGGGTTPTPTPNPTPSPVTKPAEVPSHIWTYVMNADNAYGKGGDFALLLSAVIKKESSFGAGLPQPLSWRRIDAG